jgi:hypothetical protein
MIIFFSRDSASKGEWHREACESRTRRMNLEGPPSFVHFASIAGNKIVSMTKKNEPLVSHPEPFARYTISADGSGNSRGTSFWGHRITVGRCVPSAHIVKITVAVGIRSGVVTIGRILLSRWTMAFGVGTSWVRSAVSSQLKKQTGRNIICEQRVI